MIQTVKSIAKEHTKPLEQGNLILLEENLVHHSDFILISLLIHELQHQNDVIFVGLRENYAHYLTLSKKMGKSIQPYIKNKKLKYYEGFMHGFCGQLPLALTSPACYVTPPNFIQNIKGNQLAGMQFQKKSIILIDSLQFIPQYQIVYALYEKSVLSECRMVIGGCLSGNKAFQILKNEAEVVMKLQNDIGGYGKFRLTSAAGEVGLLWKWVQGTFQVSKFIKTDL